MPFSPAIRLCTVIDDPEIRNDRLREMKQHFTDCGYPASLIHNGKEKAKSISQQELRAIKLTFVSIHNPNDPYIWPLADTKVTFLKTSERMEKLIIGTKTSRQPYKLKHILTHAKSSTQYSSGVSSKCKD